MIVTQLPSHYQ